MDVCECRSEMDLFYASVVAHHTEDRYEESDRNYFSLVWNFGFFNGRSVDGSSASKK